MTSSTRVCLSGWLACAVAVVSLASGTPAGAQDAPPMPEPTKEHELLKKDVGAWDAAVTVWHEPGGEPMVSKATERNELLGNGMWLMSRFEGTLAGMPFTGAGAFGYDPIEKKYVGTWVDSMTPHLMTMKGDYDAATKTMTTMAEGRDPATGKMIVFKQIGRHIDDNTRTFEIHMPGEKAQYWKLMEIRYTRRAE